MSEMVSRPPCDEAIQEPVDRVGRPVRARQETDPAVTGIRLAVVDLPDEHFDGDPVRERLAVAGLRIVGRPLSLTGPVPGAGVAELGSSHRPDPTVGGDGELCATAAVRG